MKKQNLLTIIAIGFANILMVSQSTAIVPKRQAPAVPPIPSAKIFFSSRVTNYPTKVELTQNDKALFKIEDLFNIGKNPTAKYILHNLVKIPTIGNADSLKITTKLPNMKNKIFYLGFNKPMDLQKIKAIDLNEEGIVDSITLN